MHRIFYLYPLVTILVGYHLSTTIQSGKTWAIVIQSFACLFIIATTILAYKVFYQRGKIAAYKEERDYLEKLKRDKE